MGEFVKLKRQLRAVPVNPDALSAELVLLGQPVGPSHLEGKPFHSGLGTSESHLEPVER